jgi:hypothetical protein
MLDSTSGCAALVKKDAANVVITLCFLHWQALKSDTLPTILDEVLSTSVKVVNCIRASTLSQQLSKRFGLEMGALHRRFPVFQRTIFEGLN